MKLALSFLATAALLNFAPAYAQESSFTIQVTIPPLGAAQSAQEAGAVGSWTVLSPGGGLMIAPPSSDNGLTIYRNDSNRFSLRAPDGRVLTPNAQSSNRGLTALHFGNPDRGGQGAGRPLVTIAGL